MTDVSHTFSNLTVALKIYVLYTYFWVHKEGHEIPQIVMILEVPKNGKVFKLIKVGCCYQYSNMKKYILHGKSQLHKILPALP